MKTNTTTIKEIAILLGISTSTVSRALRGLPDIKPETHLPNENFRVQRYFG